MKTIIIILSLFITAIGFSQTTIDKSSIDSGGAVATDGAVNVIYTIGEVAVQETTVGAIHISEGFISAGSIVALELERYTPLLGVNIYPNPAIDFVNISLVTTANYEISIYDFLGRKTATYQVTNSDSKRIALSQLANATYIVLIKNNDTKQFASYKLIKE